VDGGQGLVQKGIATEHQRYCVRVSVTHSADDGETITRARHVQVGYQNVKVFFSDATERVFYARYRDYLKAVAFQRHLQHLPHSLVVVGQQNSWYRHFSSFLAKV
jgi:hypothetical protein